MGLYNFRALSELNRLYGRIKLQRAELALQKGWRARAVSDARSICEQNNYLSAHTWASQSDSNTSVPEFPASPVHTTEYGMATVLIFEMRCRIRQYFRRLSQSPAEIVNFAYRYRRLLPVWTYLVPLPQHSKTWNSIYMYLPLL